MRYRLSEEAKSDLKRLHQYGVYRFGEKQADKYFTTFFEQFEVITKRPFLYPEVNHLVKGFRRCVCGVDSIYYRIENNVIEIITIIGRQDIQQKLKKIQKHK